MITSFKSLSTWGLHEFGKFVLFFVLVVRTSIRTRGNRDKILAQILDVTVRSLPTVAFAGVFVGAILVLQFNQMLAQYDAQAFLGGLNTSSVVREVGPLIISFLLAGKVGAYTAAELGTMRVTEQIDAIECLGTNPIQYLIVPRFVGIIFSSLLLLSLGLMISVVGSLLVANLLCGINPLQYLNSVPRFTDLSTVAGGLFRSAIYGTIVASVSTYSGYTASGGARGVGRAVTLAAIYTNLFIVVANFVTANILDFLAQLFDALVARFGGLG